VELPQDLVIQNIYTHCKRPFYKKNEGVYNAECCICKEGNSSGTKRRLFYFPGERYFYCFNCGQSWSEMNWLTEVTGMQPAEVLREAVGYVPDITSSYSTKLVQGDQDVSIPAVIPPVPSDSVNILDNKQLLFFKDKKESKLIEYALQYCIQRRLTTAINRPRAFYVSWQDLVHADRLIIPFYNDDDKLYTYQSRTLFNKSGSPKYLTKYGDKCFYGENNINENIPYLFITEGPIDSMFIENGLGAGGAKTTEQQKLFLSKHFDKQVVHVFDNDRDNLEMQKTVQKVISKGEKVFIWPKEFKAYKDINEVCCKFGLDKISTDFIIKNTYSGTEAQLKYKLSLL
jgi:hypothetical protein